MASHEQIRSDDEYVESADTHQKMRGMEHMVRPEGSRDAWRSTPDLHYDQEPDEFDENYLDDPYDERTGKRLPLDAALK